MESSQPHRRLCATQRLTGTTVHADTVRDTTCNEIASRGHWPVITTSGTPAVMISAKKHTTQITKME